MADVAVLNLNEVSLDGTIYPLTGPVQRFLASIYPGKVVVGDTGRDSNPNASPLARSDWSGGIGLFKDDGVSPQARSWFSTCSLRYKALTLPGLANLTAASGVSGSFSIGAIGELADEIYVPFGTSVRKLDDVNDSWGNELHALPAVATDVITVRMGGTVYIVFAHTGGYSYSSDGSSCEDLTKATKYLEFWDDKLYGIGNDGLLWSSSTIGTESNDAQLPLPDGYVTGLFKARDAAGTVILYASTKVGAFAHDATNTKWIEVEALKLPFHPDGGRGTTPWRDAIYTPAGLGVYKFINGSNSAVLTIMGPDRDDGLPSDKRATIKRMVSTHNDLIALLDSTTAANSSELATFVSRGMGSHRGVVIDPDQGFSGILGWNEFGWEVKWLSGSSARPITYAHISSAYGEYRMWWALGDRIYHMRQHADIINPNEISDFPYALASEDESPWYNIGQMEVNKLGLRLRVETLDLSADETVTVSIGYDLATGYTQLGAITTDGVTTYELPNSSTPTGTAFLWFRIKIALARGSTNTKTPQMVNWTMEYRKKLPVKWGFNVTLDLSQANAHGNTPEELRTAIDVTLAKDVLVPFLWRDDDSGGSTFYVDVSQDTGNESTGHDHRGQERLALVER